jgi:hypothetical protein
MIEVPGELEEMSLAMIAGSAQAISHPDAAHSA